MTTTDEVDRHSEKIRAQLDILGISQADVLRAFAQPEHWAVQQARDDYTNDEIEIDDEPLISETDEGAWVGAWVWVPNEHVD